MQDKGVKLTTAGLISVVCFFTDCMLLITGNYWIDSKKISKVFSQIEICMFPVLLALSVYLTTKAFDQAKKSREAGRGSKKGFWFAACILGAMILVLLWVVIYLAVPAESA